MKIEALLGFQYSGGFVFEYLSVFALQLFLYITAAGLVSTFNKTLQKFKVGTRIEPRENYPGQLWVDIKGSIRTCAVIALYFYISFFFIREVYPDSFVSAIYHIFAFVLIYDLYMYLTHRALHKPMLARFHAVHHKAVSATPWSSLNMHLVEALINYLPFLLFAYFSSVSLAVFLGIHVYLILGIANSHGNYSLGILSRIPLLKELSTFHQRHHSDGHVNYGYLFTHYDRLFGSRHTNSSRH